MKNRIFFRHIIFHAYDAYLLIETSSFQYIQKYFTERIISGTDVRKECFDNFRLRTLLLFGSKSQRHKKVTLTIDIRVS